MLTSRTGNLSATRNALADLSWAVHITFYAFIFSMPFMIFELGFAGSSIPRTLGLLFMMTTALKPQICYRRLDRALWFFAAYLVVFLVIGIRTILTLPQDTSSLITDFIVVFQTLVQVIVMFWVSSNLLADNRVARTALSAFVAGCVLLGLIQILGFTGDVYSTEGRVAAFGSNPGVIGSLYSLGLVTLIGLTYGQANTNRRARACFWVFSPVLFMPLLATGARNAILALLATCSVFLLHRASSSKRIKLWGIMLLAIACVLIGSFTNDALRARWERTLEGDSAGRDEINAQAAIMVWEKPFFGWGPVYHQVELARRLYFPRPSRDFHNLYFHMLTEVGLLGSIPFFIGVLICVKYAWRARKTTQGILPLALLTCMLVMGLGGTNLTDRILWFVFAYCAASETYPVLPRVASESVKLDRRRLHTSRPVLSNVIHYQK